MNDERDQSIEPASDEPTTEPAAEPVPTAVEPVSDPAESVDPTAAESVDPTDPAEPAETRTGEDFLVPGPSPESNEGLARWGLTWIAFSLILILLMLCVSFVCLTLANWTGFA